MGRLDGKVALITGAGRGQGRSHAVAFAREGADIVALDIGDGARVESLEYDLASSADLQETVRAVEELDRRALAVEADVRSAAAVDDAVDQALAEFGRIDVLIANHGVLSLGKFWELTEQQWTEMLDVNLSGMWRITKAVVPHMIERLQGSIVMTSSVAGLEPSPAYTHYAVAKAGVISLAKNVAVSLGRFGIRCNCVCPGAVDTDIIRWSGALDTFGGKGATRGDVGEGLRHYAALRERTYVPTESISKAMLFLASDESAHITGTVLPVEDGHLLLPGFNHNPVRS